MASDDAILARVNGILERMGNTTRFTTMRQLQEHGTAFFLAAVQRFVRRTLPGINRSPSKYDDHVQNAAVFVRFITSSESEQGLGLVLGQNVTPATIASGDRAAIIRCLEIVETVEASSPSQIPSSTPPSVSVSQVSSRMSAAGSQDPSQNTVSSESRRNEVSSEVQIISHKDLTEQHNLCVKKWNALLQRCSLPLVTSIEELKENGSSLLVLVTEALLGLRLDGIVRKPVLFEHYSHNCRIALDALERILDRTLPQLEPESLCSGDWMNLRRAGDLLFELHVSLFDDNGNARVSLNKPPQEIQVVPKASKNRKKQAGSAIKKKRKKTTKKSRNPKRSHKSKPMTTLQRISRQEGWLNELAQVSDSIGAAAKKDPTLVYKDMLSRHVTLLARKNEADDLRRKQHVLKALNRKNHADKVWMKKIEIELDRELGRRARLREKGEQHAVQKVYRTALKLERDYLREQEKLYKDERKKLEGEWLNKRESIENFFRDKYNLLNEQLNDERSKRSVQEADQRQALRRLERQLREERKTTLSALQSQLRSHDEATHFRDLRPEVVLDRLLKMSV